MKLITKVGHTMKFWHWPKKVIFGLILLLVIGGWFIFAKANAKPPVYRYSTVQSGTIQKTISASGIVNGKNSANLHFQSSGQLASISVKTGDTVKKGQLIASLDTTQLIANVNQANNNYRSAQAAVTNVINQINQYQYGQEIGPTQETFAMQANRTAAQVTRDNAYDSINAARDALNNATIYSPLAGLVTSTSGLPGQNVTAGDTIAQVIDLAAGIVFEADVDESDITKIVVGQAAQVTLNSYGDKVFNGYVSEVKPITKTTTNGATVVTVKIDLSQSGVAPIAGLNGQAEIVQEQKTNVLFIPQDAVRSDNTVLVKNGTNPPTPVKVTTGLMSDTDVEITSGLQAGQEVVTNPPAPGSK